jgi:hypothetical protein
MRTIEVVYSPLCETNGAFIGKLTEWLEETDVNIKILPYHELMEEKRKYYHSLSENCFIDVYYNGDRIDYVPLNKERIYKALDILKNDNIGNLNIIADSIIRDTEGNSEHSKIQGILEK